VKDGRCNKGELSVPFVKKMPASKKPEPQVQDVVCPGGTSDCPQGSTCCQLADGEYGWLIKQYKILEIFKSLTHIFLF
jgi:hypothetical protein